MTFSEFKNTLPQVRELIFTLPDLTEVPSHFHITEIGLIEKHFIDCGGTVRHESKINLQLLVAGDIEHRLSSGRLRKIIAQSERALELRDAEIEVEYQKGDTISKYGLAFDAGRFGLTPIQTACLAEDACGIPAQELSIYDVKPCCSPNTTSCC